MRSLPWVVTITQNSTGTKDMSEQSLMPLALLEQFSGVGPTLLRACMQIFLRTLQTYIAVVGCWLTAPSIQRQSSRHVHVEQGHIDIRDRKALSVACFVLGGEWAWHGHNPTSSDTLASPCCYGDGVPGAAGSVLVAVVGARDSA